MVKKKKIVEDPMKAFLARVHEESEASELGYTFTSVEDHEDAKKAGHVVVNEMECDEDDADLIATCLSDSGRALLGLVVEKEEEVVEVEDSEDASDEEVCAAAVLVDIAEKVTALTSDRRISSVKQIPLPKIIRRGAGGRKESPYPFGILAVGDSFFVADTDKKATKFMIGAVHCANKRYVSDNRRFVIRFCEDGADYGEGSEFAGVAGAVIGRIA